MLHLDWLKNSKYILWQY